MRWLLDTNVLSEYVKPRPNRQVLNWITLQPLDQLALSTVTVAELRSGALLATDHRSRQELTRWIDDDVVAAFADRTLPVTTAILAEWLQIIRRIASIRRAAAPADLLLSATARLNDLTIVTRNLRDFEHSGVIAYNPWTNETYTMEGP